MPTINLTLNVPTQAEIDDFCAAYGYKVGTEMQCETCPVFDSCNPHTIIRNDRRIQTMGTHAGDQFCKLK